MKRTSIIAVTAAILLGCGSQQGNEGHTQSDLFTPQSSEQSIGLQLTNDCPQHPLGLGTQEDPFQLCSFAHLQRLHTANGHGHYRLTANINGNSQFWPSITRPFYGSLDGNGFAIEDLEVSRGFFNLLGRGSVVKNLSLVDFVAHEGGTLAASILGKVVNVRVDNGHVVGNIVGGLAGQLYSYGTIVNCSISARVEGYMAGGIVGRNYSGAIETSTAEGRVEAMLYAGGLVGESRGDIINSSATNRVEGIYAGGLVGSIKSGRIFSSYSKSHVEGGYAAGGLIGIAREFALSNSYSVGTIESNAPDYVGGLIGRFISSDMIASKVTNSYFAGDMYFGNAIAGGDQIDKMRGVIWNSDYIAHVTANQNEGVIRSTTAEMNKMRTYLDLGWQFGRNGPWKRKLSGLPELNSAR